MAKRTIRFVSPTDDGWKVTKNGRTESNHRTKETAVKKAVKESNADKRPSTLKIQKEKGGIQEERTYHGKDPFPPKG
ncbi:MAG: DUF2188 domain-containing protein [Planctomycetota bacterium]